MGSACSKHSTCKLTSSCKTGKSDFVANFVSQNKDIVRDIDWIKLLHQAYSKGHRSVVECIVQGGRATLQDWMEAACKYDWQLVFDHLKDPSTVKDLDWKKLLAVAHRDDLNVAYFICDSEILSFEDQVLAACEHTQDDQLLCFCIIEHGNKGKNANVDIPLVMYTACKNDNAYIAHYLMDVWTQVMTLPACMYWFSYTDNQESMIDILKQKLDIGKKVDWVKLLDLTYSKNKLAVVDIILHSDRMTLYSRLYAACRYGDETFVTQAICEVDLKNRDIDYRLMKNLAQRRGHRTLATYLQSMWKVEADIESISLNLASCNLKSQPVNTRSSSSNSPEAVAMVHTVDTARFIAANEDFGADYDNQLLVACLEGDIKYVTQKTRTGTMLHGFDYFRIAFAQGHSDIVDLLCSHVTLQELVAHIDDAAASHVILRTERNLNEDMRPGLNLLQVAAYKRQINVIHGLGERGADLQVVDAKKRTLLHLACLPDSDEIDELILGNKDVQGDVTGNNSPKEVDTGRVQSIDKLIKQLPDVVNTRPGQQLESIQYLLTNKVGINAADEKAQTPLHLACISGDEHSVQLLLESGSDPNLLDGAGMSPLMIGSIQGHHKAVVRLIQHRRCILTILNLLGQSAFYNACQMNQYKVVEVFLQQGPRSLVDQPDHDGVTPLSISSWGGHEAIVTLLLHNNVDVNIVDAEGQVALHKAVMAGHIEIIRLLLQHSLDLNQQDAMGCTCLHIASQKDIHIVAMLLEAGSGVDVPNNLGNSALHVAVLSQQPEIVRLLLSKGAHINRKNNCGESPMFSAVAKLDVDMIDVLIDNGGELDTADNMGRGLVHKVFTSVYHGMVLHKLLLTARGVTVTREGRFTVIDLVTGSGQHQMFVVKENGSLFHSGKQLSKESMASAFNTSVLESLLSKGVDMDAADFNDQTSLHLAATSGQLLATQFLLEHGADFLARDKFGHLPIMLSLKHPQVFCMMLEWYQSYHFTTADIEEFNHLAHWMYSMSILNESQLVPSSDFSQFPTDVASTSFTVDLDHLTRWLQTESEDSPSRPLPDFLAGWLSTLPEFTYVNHQRIIETLSRFVHDIAVDVEQIEPLVAFEFTLSGSEREKTKVMATDEMDALCLQTRIKHYMFHKPTAPATPILQECVGLVCKDEYVEYLQEVLDDDNRLSGAKLNKVFGNAVSKALANPNLWTRYQNLQRVTSQDVTAGNRTITALNVKWHDEVYPLLNVSIDLVPAIAIPSPEDGGWLPSWCVPHPLLTQIGCVAVPKWKSSAPTTMGLVEFGISHWGGAFDEMPAEMRQGYRMAKVVRDKAVCPQIEDWPEVHASGFISSYMLKMCIFKKYMAGSSSDVMDKSDLYWARQIYRFMEDAFSKQRLESFFIPGYNLLHDDKYVQYRETAISYARLCRRLLTNESAQHFREAYMGTHNRDLALSSHATSCFQQFKDDNDDEEDEYFSNSPPVYLWDAHDWQTSNYGTVDPWDTSNLNLYQASTTSESLTTAARATRHAKPPKKKGYSSFCNTSNCMYCKLLNRTGTLMSHTCNKSYPTLSDVSCRNSNLVYCITCTDCGRQYVGQTLRKIRDVIINGDIYNSPIGQHFRSERHVGAMEVSVLEFIRKSPSSPHARAIRNRVARKWIKCLQTSAPLGLNNQE